MDKLSTSVPTRIKRHLQQLMQLDHEVQLHQITNNQLFCLQILAFPCNQFFNQQNKTQREIKQNIKKFNVEFPMFSKIQVNGPNAHPLYKFLRRRSGLYNVETGKCKQIPWNFSKFILDGNGKVIKYQPPTTQPIQLRTIIQSLLNDQN